MLFPLLVLVLFTLFVGLIGISFSQGEMDFDILSKWLTPSTKIFYSNSNDSEDWYDFLTNAVFSVSIAVFGLFILSILNGYVYSSLQNLGLINSFASSGTGLPFHWTGSPVDSNFVYQILSERVWVSGPVGST